MFVVFGDDGNIIIISFMDKKTGPERLGDMFAVTQSGPSQKWTAICLASEVTPLYNLLFLKIIKAEMVLRNHIIQYWKTNIAHRPIPLSRADITNLSQHFFLLSLDRVSEFSVSLQLAGLVNGYNIYYLN